MFVLLFWILNSYFLSKFKPIKSETGKIHHKKIGTIKRLMEESLIELTDNAYTIKPETNFYSKETGQVYDVNKNVRDTDLKNGSRIILI